MLISELKDQYDDYIKRLEIKRIFSNVQVSNMEDHATELLSAGDKFLLTKMKRMAEKHLIENLKLSTVLEVVAHAYLVTMSRAVVLNLFQLLRTKLQKKLIHLNQIFLESQKKFLYLRSNKKLTPYLEVLTSRWLRNTGFEYWFMEGT